MIYVAFKTITLKCSLGMFYPFTGHEGP